MSQPEESSGNSAPMTTNSAFLRAIVSAVIPAIIGLSGAVITAVVTHSQSKLETIRKDKELQLAIQIQKDAKEREFFLIGVDPSRVGRQAQVLRFLARGEGALAAWAKDELPKVEHEEDSLRNIATKNQRLLDSLNEQKSSDPRRIQRIQQTIQSAQSRIGTFNISAPENSYEQGRCSCGNQSWPSITFESCRAFCSEGNAKNGSWTGEMRNQKIPIP